MRKVLHREKMPGQGPGTIEQSENTAVYVKLKLLTSKKAVSVSGCMNCPPTCSPELAAAVSASSPSPALSTAESAEACLDNWPWETELDCLAKEKVDV